jgi:hypothetical protein
MSLLLWVVVVSNVATGQVTRQVFTRQTEARACASKYSPTARKDRGYRVELRQAALADLSGSELHEVLMSLPMSQVELVVAELETASVGK